MAEVTWRSVALLAPAFVQWIVQKHGPLPDGPIRQEDYDKYAEEYYSEIERRRWK